MDYEQNQPQRVPVQLDMDKARQQLGELSEEFETLLTQAFRSAIKKAAEEQTPGTPSGGLLAESNLTDLTASASQQASLTAIENRLDAIATLLQTIAGATNRTQGVTSL